MSSVFNLVRLRRVALAVLLASVCFGTLAVTSAAASSLPPEGIFETCSLDTAMPTCLQRLQVMHQGGFQIVVIPAWAGSVDSLSTYASAAHALGMSVMWELSSPAWWRDSTTSTSMDGQFGSYAAACGCTDNGDLLAYVVRWLAAQPATYGYYAADDSALGVGDQAGMSAYVAEIKQVDPVHTVMIGAADESQAGQYQGMTDVIGTEVYPVTDSSLMPVSANQDMWSSVAQAAIDAQSMANRYGKQSAFILQAFTWGDNIDDGQAIGVCSSSDSPLSCYQKLDYPTPSAQVELRNEMLLHAHPKVILWWSFPGTYGQAGDDTYSIYPTGATASARWSGLVSAVNSPAPATTSQAPKAYIAVASAASTHKPHHRKHHKKRRHHKKHHRLRKHRRRAAP